MLQAGSPGTMVATETTHHPVQQCRVAHKTNCPATNSHRTPVPKSTHCKLTTVAVPLLATDMHTYVHAVQGSSPCQALHTGIFDGQAEVIRTSCSPTCGVLYSRSHSSTTACHPPPRTFTLDELHPWSPSETTCKTNSGHQKSPTSCRDYVRPCHLQISMALS